METRAWKVKLQCVNATTTKYATKKPKTNKTKHSSSLKGN